MESQGEEGMEKGLSRASASGFHRSTMSVSSSGMAGQRTKAKSASKKSIKDVKWLIFRLSHEQKVVLLMVSFGHLSTWAAYSIMAPFYPKEADGKGVSSAVQGWIFGVYALGQVVTSPLFGHFASQIGAKPLFVLGLFFGGGTTALFGALTYVPFEGDDAVLYTVLCFVLRFSTALGTAAFSTSAFTYIATHFEDNAVTILGLMETVVGVGMMLGPALGGALFDAGGYFTTFAVMGGIMFLAAACGAVFLPPEREVPLKATGGERLSPWKFLWDPSALIISLSLAVTAIVWAAGDPILEPHLREFDLDPELIGVIFLMSSGTFAIMSPVVGWFIDHFQERLDSKLLMIAGYVLCGAGDILLGPSPILGLGEGFNELWLDITSLLIIGIGLALAIVPTFDQYIISLEKRGFPSNFASFGVVSGLWNSIYSLGDFIGPSSAGAVKEAIGFSWTMSLLGCFSVAMIIILIGLILYEKCGESDLWDEHEYVDITTSCPVTEVEDTDRETADETTPLVK